MFETILIANRGEIACRVMETAQAMGVRCVAVYSDADAQAKHVAMADVAVHIGGSSPAQSYLRGDVIIRAALDTGAQAIHPGYGFLSENPDFVDAVEAAGLVFIGPSAAAIRAMGLKDAAKALMIEAGVPVVPGYHGADQDDGLLADEAGKIGYPGAAARGCVWLRRRRGFRRRWSLPDRRPGRPLAMRMCWWRNLSPSRAISRCRSLAMARMRCICSSAIVPCSGAIRR
jgi:pyruvate carboxylase